MTIIQMHKYTSRPNATAITLDKSSIGLTTVWDTAQITATLTPSNAGNSITWSSSDTTIATVSQSWLVTCVTPWTATITATTDNWLSATCGVTQWWAPWANTICYYTFDNQNLDDSSWNNNNWTWYNWTGSFTANTWWYCANLGSSHAIQLPFTAFWTTDFTLNEWIKFNSFSKSLQGLNQRLRITPPCARSTRLLEKK